jgi:hypothetical protein
MIRYRGRTEDERIECALKARDIEQAIEFLAGARMLTQSILDTLQECRALFVEAEDAPGGDVSSASPEGKKPPTSPPKEARSIRQVE